MIEPLIRLKRYDANRQTLMRSALEQLKGLENLSGDLFEKISKALDA
jgi:aminopeptidase N